MEDEDENPFVEHRVHRRQPLVQAQANRWESGFKLDIPEFQGCFQLEELLVTEKVEKISKRRCLERRRRLGVNRLWRRKIDLLRKIAW
jgi:hypothetical protein